MTRKLPPQEREKDTSIRKELENQQKGIRFLTPGSDLWQKVSEELARLEAVLTQGGGRIAYPKALKDSARFPTVRWERREETTSAGSRACPMPGLCPLPHQNPLGHKAFTPFLSRKRLVLPCTQAYTLDCTSTNACTSQRMETCADTARIHESH